MEADILLWIQEHLRNPYLNPVVEFITSLGNAGIFWIILAIVLVSFAKTRKAGAACLLALVFSLLINNMFLKNVVARTRPYEVIEGLHALVGRQRDFSFPSGHAAASFAAATALYLNLPKKYGVPLLVLAALIALSRLYVGVHYPTDVLAGSVSGILCGCAAGCLCNYFQKFSSK